MVEANEADKAVLRQLKAHGSDLTKPHKIEFFFYFPSEALAKSAVAEIESGNLEVEIRAENIPWWKKLFTKQQWCCCASKTMIPEEEAVFETTAKFNEIANRFSGIYDGWVAEVTT